MTAPIIAADVDDLVRQCITPREHLHLSATQSRPNALTYALCRVFGATGEFLISTTAVHSSAHAIALSGCARRVVAGFVGDTYPSPRPNALYDCLLEDDPFVFEAWSLLSYTQRLIAGAMGVPYAVTASLTGTDLADGKGLDLHRIVNPKDTDESVTLVSALRPDVTLVHGACADRRGNVVLLPPYGEGAWASYAAKRGVIASVERIVSDEEMAELFDRVVIPGQRVIGLCEAPLGAHPQSLRATGLPAVSGYLDDYRFIEDIVDSCNGPARGEDWYQEWVLGVSSHDGYLTHLGEERRRQLEQGASGPPAEPVHKIVEELEPSEEPPTKQERLIVLGARAVVDRVRAGHYDTLLAGIGSSHIAAWLAAELLRREGCEVKVVAELGAYGFTPEGGDVFLFSLRHAEQSEGLSGIAEILGGMVAANPRALGVLGAAEVDQTGTINTSRTKEGRWLTGSGGANDIASTTDCVVVATASRRRFVQTVGYRTSPGDRVLEIVSQFGRFRRVSPDSFRLASWLPEDSDNVPDDPQQLQAEALEVVAQYTSWNTPAEGLVVEKDITPDELALLRTFDPEGRYR